jgi:hypothetical protein
MILLDDGDVSLGSVSGAEEDASETTELKNNYFYSSLEKARGRDVVM